MWPVDYHWSGWCESSSSCSRKGSVALGSSNIRDRECARGRNHKEFSEPGGEERGVGGLEMGCELEEGVELGGRVGDGIVLRASIIVGL